MELIDLDSIRKKVKVWEYSPDGQKKLQQKVNNYILHNVERTQAGAKVLTRRQMIEYADKLIGLIKATANSCSLPASVAAHFDSLKRGKCTMQHDGSFIIEISFTDDLSRDSLEPEKYGGVKNIIAIFNNGYPRDRSRSESISHVTGWWHGKETRALEYRPGLYFLQDAVNDFNITYGIPNGMYAELDAIYDE